MPLWKILDIVLCRKLVCRGVAVFFLPTYAGIEKNQKFLIAIFQTNHPTMKYQNLYLNLQQVHVHAVRPVLDENGDPALRIFFEDNVQREVFLDLVDELDNIGDHYPDEVDEVNGFEVAGLDLIEM